MLKFEWEKSNFHQNYAQVLKRFSYYITKDFDFLSKLIERLDWSNLSSFLSVSSVGLFLSFYFDCNLLKCEKLLRKSKKGEKGEREEERGGEKIEGGEKKSETEEKKKFLEEIVEWEKCGESLLSFFSDENLLTHLLFLNLIEENCSEELIENMKLLRMIVEKIKNDQITFQFALHLKNILFSSIKDEERQKYWYFSFKEHIQIISEILIPISNLHFEASKYNEMMMSNLISCINVTTWKEPISVPSFILSFSSQLPEQDVSNIKELQKTVIKTLNDSFATSNREFSLQFLSQAPKLIESPITLFPLLESSLRCYFGDCEKDENPLRTACENLLLPLDMHMHHCMACISTHSSLTLIAVIEKQRILCKTLPKLDWIKQFATPTLSYLTNFQPDPKYPVDILALWLYSLSILSEKRFPCFLPESSVISSSFEGKCLEPYKKYKLLLSSNFNLPKSLWSSRTELGAASILYMLTRLAFEKMEEIDEKKMVYALNDHKKKIMVYKKNVDNKEILPFFDSIEKFSSPKLTEFDFQNEVSEKMLNLNYFKSIFKVNLNT